MSDKLWSPAPVVVACWSCKHKRAYAVCAAFPDGIPTPILAGFDDHRKPYRGDSGITYERRTEDVE